MYVAIIEVIDDVFLTTFLHCEWKKVCTYVCVEVNQLFAALILYPCYYNILIGAYGHRTEKLIVPSLELVLALQINWNWSKVEGQLL